MGSKFFGFFKRHYILTIIMAVFVSGMAFAVTEKIEIYKWRYKMIVTVDTPEGIKTGSAVREVIVSIKPFPLDRRRPWRSAVTVKGEAIVVNLGRHGTFFALLDGDDAYRVVFETFPFTEGGLTPEGVLHYSQLKADRASVKQIPTMVSFRNMTDPNSIEPVDRNDLSKSFGSGVSLKNVTIEMTDKPVTWTIDKILPWLSSRTVGSLDGATARTGSSYANLFDSGYFKRGE